MKITFLGATKEVTGSNFLVEGAGKKFLVDCGMFQGSIQEEMENEEDFLYDVHDIDFVLVTHAHIDHTGRIPKLYKCGYRNPVIATKATCDLCTIMLPDSGHIQETEIEWKNRRRIREGKDPLPPLYTAQEATDCLELFKPVYYDQIVDLADNIQARFNDAGHMLGSSMIEIWITEDGETKKLVFSGDIGNNDMPLLAAPTMIESADYLIMESTYGNRLHMRNCDKAQTLLKVVSETLDYGGKVIVPSFAVGRTQEILYEINRMKDQYGENEEFRKHYKTLMDAKVFVDSPLAISATEIFKKNMDLFDESVQEEIKKGDNPFDFPDLNFAKTAEESMALNGYDEPCIILSASGMCEVGRIKHHLKHNLWDPKNTILFVGYQAQGTLGRSIVDGAKKVKIFGEEIAVNARVEYIEGFSGHADQEWLLNFIYSFINKPKHIFLVHGEKESQIVLKQKLLETTQIPVTIPDFGDCYELNDQLELVAQKEVPDKYKYLRLSIIGRIETLKEELDDMESIVKDTMLTEDASDEDLVKLNEKVKDLEKKIVDIIDEK